MCRYLTNEYGTNYSAIQETGRYLLFIKSINNNLLLNTYRIIFHRIKYILNNI